MLLWIDRIGLTWIEMDAMTVMIDTNQKGLKHCVAVFKTFRNAVPICVCVCVREMT